MNNQFLYVTKPSLLTLAIHLANFTQNIQVVTLKPLNRPIFLQLDDNGLAIISALFKPIYVQEIYANLKLRTHNLRNLKNELLIQAIKLPPNNSHIWDLTAGLGKDAVLMASFGYTVTMVEKNPILATVLYYLLQHNYLMDNMHLVYANSIDYLINYGGEKPQVIYLDPMFKQIKSAKAKKEMQLIQLLDFLTPTQFKEEQQLVTLALAIVQVKLIVKRENKQLPLVNYPPVSYTKLGKTIRYDVYLT